MIRTHHTQAEVLWQNAREVILGSLHGLRGLVADLAHVYHQRVQPESASSRLEGIAQASNLVESAIQAARAAVHQLMDAEQRLTKLAQELNVLYQESLPRLQQAREVIAQIERLRAATQILEVAIPQSIQEQMREWEERLASYLRDMADDFAELPHVARDPVFLDALQELDTLCQQVDQILRPIRPSVFARPLNRPEEVSRLALIALCVYTDRPDSFRPSNPHKGVGKNTAPDVLVLADLIDESEHEAAAQAIFAFQTDAGARLASKQQRGLYWFYRVTPEGIEQAQEWLQDTLDPRGLERRINDAIELRRATREPWKGGRAS